MVSVFMFEVSDYLFAYLSYLFAHLRIYIKHLLKELWYSLIWFIYQIKRTLNLSGFKKIGIFNIYILNEVVCLNNTPSQVSMQAVHVGNEMFTTQWLQVRSHVYAVLKTAYWIQHKT